jgi:hypothetical protein
VQEHGLPAMAILRKPSLACHAPTGVHHRSLKSHLDFNYPLSTRQSLMISLSSFHAMLIPILAGMIMLAIGFNFRDKNAGVFAMWIGMLMILATVVFKILAKLNE